MSKLRVGFLVDGLCVSHYVSETIASVTNDPAHFERPLIISQQIKQRSKSTLSKVLASVRDRGLKFIFTAALTEVIRRLELKRLRNQRLYREYDRTIEVNDLGLKTIETCPIISKSGFVHRFSDSDVNKIKAERLDVLIRCGNGILKGDILSAARFGVLSFHHGDNRVNRGGPSGFWEVFFDQPSSGFVIQQLTEELDGGNVILRGNIMTSSYWLANNAQLLLKSNIFMTKTLRSLSENQELPPFEQPLPYSNRLFRAPGVGQLCKYAIKEYSAFIKGLLLSRIGYRNRWSVSFVSKTGLGTVFFRATTIPNPENRFLADPFIIGHEGRNICFVEDYFFDEDKGKISAYELRDNSCEELGIVLEEDFHLSFPFVFKHDGDVYMIPESSANRDIRLYKCVAFPHDWRLEKILMASVDAADTMVFLRDETWFMLTNICSAGVGDYQSELHVFYSADLLSTTWQPISTNPIIFDSRKARNGGLFEIGERLFRINQVHGKNHYGRSFEINEIREITTETYLEAPICHIEPNYFDDLRSTHHLHMNESYTVFDHSRMEKMY